MKQLVITASTTRRDAASLNTYFRDISKYPLLTPDEEVQLAIRIQLGDQRALERMVQANLRFVVSVSKKYQGMGLSLSDLINEGNLGLITAAERFDHTKGFKFISYAVWWIRQNIIKALQDTSRVVRIPSNKLDAIYKVKKASAGLEQAFERMPTSEELAEALDLQVDLVSGCLKLDQRSVSLDAPLSDEAGAGTRLDLMSDESGRAADQGLEAVDLARSIDGVMDVLTVREADCLRMLFGLGGGRVQSLEEVSMRFGVTRERARQIRDKALAKLRQQEAVVDMKTYL
ncbi:RNA polymerase sigma factor RpoD/SigA [Flavobacteriales bacterium]|nr:RNA polymerase sigma factor RpoD/SigA [Flavobacteriales bacterium]